MKLFGHFTFTNSPRCTTLHLPPLQNTTEKGACSFCKNLKTSTSFVKTFQVRSQVYLISPFTIAKAFAYFFKGLLGPKFPQLKKLISLSADEINIFCFDFFTITCFENCLNNEINSLQSKYVNHAILSNKEIPTKREWK